MSHLQKTKNTSEPQNQFVVSNTNAVNNASFT